MALLVDPGAGNIAQHRGNGCARGFEIARDREIHMAAGGKRYQSDVIAAIREFIHEIEWPPASAPRKNRWPPTIRTGRPPFGCSHPAAKPSGRVEPSWTQNPATS